MKCIAAVVMMALAVVAEAGYSPLLYSAPLAYSGHTTIIQGHPAGPAKISELPALAYSAPALPAPAYAYSYPGYYAYSAPLASAPALLLQKEARYLAANRGAIHEAPLPGHEISQQQLNLEPAAGSI
ncbi:adult cuticle protein 1-like [Topomyia yanbarensis]|uniref:adult cuticle protein 1-like n=1 Tax=Topomyia yanbarensis TaxID=2498891 RepID=UPI00273BC9B4|nr:adult cuticle protein 1-like [Topomyia yanbarensis]